MGTELHKCFCDIIKNLGNSCDQVQLIDLKGYFESIIHILGLFWIILDISLFPIENYVIPINFEYL